MIDKSQPKCPSTIRGGCVTPTPPPRWACVVVPEPQQEQFGPFTTGAVLPYWGVSEFYEKPIYFWDGEAGALNTIILAAHTDEDPPAFKLWFQGATSEHGPINWASKDAFVLGQPAFPQLQHTHWLDSFGFPVTGWFPDGIFVYWFRTYDLLKASYPDALDPLWKSL
jgi:hypothetical protein